VAEPDWLRPDAKAADVEIAGRALRLTSLDKVLYPLVGFTKRDLIAYYARVSGVLLPHIAGLPLTLGRWPSGVNGRGFAQMECRGAPEWMTTRPLALRSGEVRNYCVIDDLPALVWAVNLGTLEFHPYYAVQPDETHTRFAIFDLDPQGEAGLMEAARTALALRELLATRDLRGWPKTSGGDGVHVFVPLDRPHDYGTVRALCDELAAELDAPGINIDCAQNHPRRSLAAAYSLRAGDVPHVSTPVTWQEIRDAVASGNDSTLVFTADDVPPRIAAFGDLWLR
jgi:bifunctional non-homologous end joining protein LigD